MRLADHTPSNTLQATGAGRLAGELDTAQLHAEIIVDVLVLNGRVGTWTQLHALRPLLLTEGLSTGEQDAGLAWLDRYGMVAPVVTDVEGTPRRLEVTLTPENSSRRNTPRWEQAAYRLGTAHRADMIFVQDWR